MESGALAMLWRSHGNGEGNPNARPRPKPPVHNSRGKDAVGSPLGPMSAVVIFTRVPLLLPFYSPPFRG